jgi:hypothetical protein
MVCMPGSSNQCGTDGSCKKDTEGNGFCSYDKPAEWK